MKLILKQVSCLTEEKLQKHEQWWCICSDSKFQYFPGRVGMPWSG